MPTCSVRPTRPPSYLEACGLESVRQATVPGCPPAVIARVDPRARGRETCPTVLLYAHHDVQPPGYEDRWESRPVRARRAQTVASTAGAAPTTRPGAVAHGAMVKAWLDATGALPCNVKVLIEGEEEVGSPHLLAFLDRVRRRPRGRRARPRRRGQLERRHPRPHLLAARPRRRRRRRSTALDEPAALGDGRRRGARPDDGARSAARVDGRRARRRRDRRLLGRRAHAVRTRSASASPRCPSTSDRLRAAWGMQPGVELSRRPVDLRLRTPVAPAGTDRPRRRHPPDRRFVEPDRRAAAARLSFRVAPGQDPDAARTASSPTTSRSTRRGAPRVRVRRPRGRAGVVVRARGVGVRRGRRARCTRGLRHRRRSDGRRRHDPVRRPVRGRVRRHPRAACSDRPIRTAASTARTRASTSTTGASSW